MALIFSADIYQGLGTHKEQEDLRTHVIENTVSEHLKVGSTDHLQQTFFQNADPRHPDLLIQNISGETQKLEFSNSHMNYNFRMTKPKAHIF